MSIDRPQYGEYATPEEQRARAGLPPLETETETAAAAPGPAPQRPSSTAPTAPASGQTPATAPATPVIAGLGRVVTFALLGVGLVNVLTSIAGFMDLSTTLNATLRMLGIEGEFSNFGAARTWGVIAAVVMMAGYAGTVWWAFRRLNRRRSSWWVPLVGFAVTMTLVSMCISVPMFGDPAFTQGLLTPPAG